MITYTHIPSPVGPLLLATSNTGLRLIEFPSPKYPEPIGPDWHPGDHPILHETRQQLDAYFAGTLRTFTLPLAPGGTPFQAEVWHRLATIPYGHTVSYGELAQQLGRPRAVRAVGAANGRNPLPIVLPCHRVIGADGSLTGFGGGLPIKRYLLTLEGAIPEDDLFGHPLPGTA